MIWSEFWEAITDSRILNYHFMQRHKIIFRELVYYQQVPTTGSSKGCASRRGISRRRSPAQDWRAAKLMSVWGKRGRRRTQSDQGSFKRVHMPQEWVKTPGGARAHMFLRVDRSVFRHPCSSWCPFPPPPSQSSFPHLTKERHTSYTPSVLLLCSVPVCKNLGCHVKGQFHLFHLSSVT